MAGIKQSRFVGKGAEGPHGRKEAGKASRDHKVRFADGAKPKGKTS